MPDQIQICSNCVLDTKEVPDLTFDCNGVCQYCIDWHKREKTRLLEAQELPWILDDIRKQGRGKQYDCPLGLSGGVDSSLCLHYLVENEIRPLCWSMDNGYNSDVSDENIMKMVEKLKIPFIKKVIDLNEYSDLQAAFLKSGVKNIEIPTDHILMALQYETAIEHGINRIIGGGNHATEGIMPESYGYNAQDLRHILAIYKKFCKRKRPDLPLMSLFGYIKARFIKDIRVINLLDFYPNYNRSEAIEFLKDRYDYVSYGEKHCENTFTSWFQTWYLPNKWGLDKRKPHFSSLINSGQMTRKEAMQKLLERQEFPELNIEDRIMKFARHEHSYYKNSKRLRDFLSRIYVYLKR